jgi:DNA-binding transcriptional MerR regulator
MTAVIPDKRFFRIAEVSRIVGVPAHVLRYWEREFSVVRPHRTPTNQRLYRRSDILALLHIKTLLYQEHYTIAGARRKLAASRRGAGVGTDAQILDHVRQEIIALRRLLE